MGSLLIPQVIVTIKVTNRIDRVMAERAFYS